MVQFSMISFILKGFFGMHGMKEEPEMEHFAQNRWLFSQTLEPGSIVLDPTKPRHPVIPPEYMFKTHVFGVHIPSQEV